MNYGAGARYEEASTEQATDHVINLVNEHCQDVELSRPVLTVPPADDTRISTDETDEIDYNSSRMILLD